MTSIIALSSGTGWHIEDLTRAAAKLGVGFRALPFDQLSAMVGETDASSRVQVGSHDLFTADAVLVRMMPPGSLEQVVFRMDALYRLSARGVPVMNSPRAVEASVDKYLTLALLASAGLPTPATWAGQKAAEALEVFERLGGDVVVKPLFGAEGRGIVRVSDKETAWRIFHALERLGSVLYLQRVVRHPGHDYRVFVLGGDVLGVMRRRATAGEWRSNVALGGRAEACPLDPEAARLAIAAATAVGADMAGVDLIPDLDSGRLVVIEVNAVPGWRALSRVTGIDVAAAVLNSLVDRSRSRERRGLLSPGQLAQLACVIEATARKPGNVHPCADFADLGYLEFILSAGAIVDPLDRAAETGVGRAVHAAIAATRRRVETNTNLGLVLLLAPLAAVGRGEPIEAGVVRVLAQTTVDDARWVYRAIRLAQPGGLGTVADQDVAGEPTVTLREAMALAGDRDLVARQYALGYRDVFELALPCLANAIDAGRSLETAVVLCYLSFLAKQPDTLIARKHGLAVAREVSAAAARVLEAGWPESEEGRRRCDEIEGWLRDPSRRYNPGATADLVAAALFAALRDGKIKTPLDRHGWRLPM